jgi:Phosphodiester glycosidase
VESGRPPASYAGMGLFNIAPSGGSYTLRFFGGGIAVLAVCAVVMLLRRRRRLAGVALAGMLALGAIWIGLYVARPGWLTAALADPHGGVETGEADWAARAPGLETADLEIRLHGEPVDSIALVRLDPARYAMSVHWDGDATRTAEDWQRELGAAVVVNGSYFEPDGTPSTPLKIHHQLLGPRDYVSAHGALVIGDRIDIVDLRGRDVATALAPYGDAMVSYPLLVAPDGTTRATGHTDWFANRHFIGIDRQGRVIIGTTRTGFFSLPRLGELLARSSLGLRIALNLDGGPLASQIVEVGGWQRVVHGNAEVTGAGDLLRLRYQAHEPAVRLPIVLAIEPRNETN